MSDERFEHAEDEPGFYERKRAYTEMDRSRTRGQAPVFSESAVVATWLCRGRCGAVVEVTDAALEAMQAFNRQLIAKREPMLDTSRIVFCVECKKRGRAGEAEQNRRVQNQIAERIRELKSEPAPHRERERALCDELRKLGCDGVDELVKAIAERREGKTAGKSRFKGDV